MMSFADRFWPDGPVIVSHSAWHIDTPDDISMNAIETSLAILQEGTTLASKLPFIAPIAGLLLQALTMRDARVSHISSVSVLMIVYLGSEAVQIGMRNRDVQTGKNCEDHCQRRRVVRNS